MLSEKEGVSFLFGTSEGEKAYFLFLGPVSPVTFFLVTGLTGYFFFFFAQRARARARSSFLRSMVRPRIARDASGRIAKERSE